MIQQVIFQHGMHKFHARPEVKPSPVAQIMKTASKKVVWKFGFFLSVDRWKKPKTRTKIIDRVQRRESKKYYTVKPRKQEHTFLKNRLTIGSYKLGTCDIFKMWFLSQGHLLL